MTNRKRERTSERPRAIPFHELAALRSPGGPPAAHVANCERDDADRTDNPEFDTLPEAFRERVNAKFQRGIELGEMRDHLAAVSAEAAEIARRSVARKAAARARAHAPLTHRLDIPDAFERRGAKGYRAGRGRP